MKSNLFCVMLLPILGFIANAGLLLAKKCEGPPLVHEKGCTFQCFDYLLKDMYCENDGVTAFFCDGTSKSCPPGYTCQRSWCAKHMSVPCSEDAYSSNMFFPDLCIGKKPYNSDSTQNDRAIPPPKYGYPKFTESNHHDLSNNQMSTLLPGLALFLIVALIITAFVYARKKRADFVRRQIVATEERGAFLPAATVPNFISGLPSGVSVGSPLRHSVVSTTPIIKDLPPPYSATEANIMPAPPSYSEAIASGNNIPVATISSDISSRITHSNES